MNLDAKINNQITRNDYPQIIALNRQLASLQPVRLKYSATGYAAGTVLARKTADGIFEAYDDGGSGGVEVAACVLLDQVAAEDFTAPTGTGLARGIFAGYLFKDKLTGLDANAITDLGAKTIIDANGVNILKF